MEGRPIWIYLALGAVVLIVGFAVVKKTLTSPQAIATVQSEQMRQTPTAAGSATISIASSNTKQDWLHQVVQTFNAASKTDTTLQVGDRPIFVKVIQENIDGKKVDNLRGLRRVLMQLEADKEYAASVEREGESRELKLTPVKP